MSAQDLRTDIVYVQWGWHQSQIRWAAQKIPRRAILQKLYFAKILLPAQRRLIVFAYFSLVNLLTYCKYHRINLHANFKEHCKWAKK